MTAVVVFNPTNVPVRTTGVIVGTGEWVFVDDIAKVSSLIAAGSLVVCSAPADPTQINPDAAKAFEKLAEHDSTNVGEKVVERNKRKSRNNKSQSITDHTEGE